MFHVLNLKYECDMKAKKWTRPSIRRRNCGYHKIFKGSKPHKVELPQKRRITPKKI